MSRFLGARRRRWNDGGGERWRKRDRLDAWCCLMRTMREPILTLRDLDFDLRIRLSIDDGTPLDLPQFYHQIAKLKWTYTGNIGS